MPVHAIIDIGSNSIKLLVADIAADRNYTVLAEDSQVTGLSEGLQPGSALKAEAVERTLLVLHQFREQASTLGAERIVACGTAALRDASDAEAFLARAAVETGVEIRILSGLEEAQIGRLPALQQLNSEGGLVLFDTGGGSTEVTWLLDGAVLFEASLPLGARRMTDAAGVTQPVLEHSARTLRRLIGEVLKEGWPNPSRSADLRVAAIGGTSSQAAKLVLGTKNSSATGSHIVITRADLERLHDEISPVTLDELRRWPKLSASRAPIIYAGVCILAAVLDYVDASAYILIDRGLRYGLLLESAALIEPEAAVPD